MDLYEVKGESVSVTDDERARLGVELMQEVDSCEESKSGIRARWERVENVYRCDPKCSNLNLVDGLQPYVFPLYRQKANAIARSVQSAYFTVKPWAQLMSVTEDSVEGLEQTIQHYIEESNLKNEAMPTLLNMIHFNCGVMRAMMNDDGRLQCDNIHPEHFMAYPVQVSDVTRCKSLGHRFYVMRWQVEADIDEGEYEGDKSKLGSAEQPTLTRDRLQVKDQPVTNEDEKLELWDILTYRQIGKDKKRTWYRAIVERQSRQVLKLEKYTYESPWYFNFRTDYVEQTMFPSDSVGHVLQGLNLAYNDAHTTLLHGSYMSAFPLTVITGGMLANKVARYQPGQIIESSDEAMKVQVVDVKFQPQALPTEAQKIEELADAVSGISRLGTSQNMPASTTATAASGFLAAQSESKDQYVEGVETTFKRLFTFILECVSKHPNAVRSILGKKYKGEVLSALDVSAIDVQPTGGGATTDPKLLGQKLAMLQEMAGAPGSELDPIKVQNKILETLDLPFASESLKKDAQVLEAMDDQGGMDKILQLAGMAGSQVPPGNGDFGQSFEAPDALPIG